MREKSPRLIVTFHTTAGAIATEQLCRRLGLAAVYHGFTQWARAGKSRKARCLYPPLYFCFSPRSFSPQ